MNKHYTLPLIVLIVILLFSNDRGFAEGYDDKVNIHGFISQGYLKSSDNNFLAETEKGSFQFNEMALNFTTHVADDLRLGIQFFARDMGTDGNDEITVDWMNADYRFRNWLGIKVGVFKSPSMFFWSTREMDMLRTSVFLPFPMYTESSRDSFASFKGVNLYGRFLLGSAGILFYSAAYYLGNYSVESGWIDSVEDQFSIVGFEATDASAANSPFFALEWHTPLQGLRIKYSYWDVFEWKITGDYSGFYADALGWDSSDMTADYIGHIFFCGVFIRSA